MSNHPHPTSAQLKYIRALALQRGRTFTPPRTKSEASQLINELKRTPTNSITEARMDVRAVRDAMQTQSGGAARVRPDETTGYGSTATWKRDAS
jgi:hypothetical protein